MIVELSFGHTDDADWRDLLRRSDGARRATLSTILEDETREAAHRMVAARWFDDRTDLERDRVELPGATTVLARPEVRRGAEWLDARWREGGARYKHVAVARRADGLTREEFAERWRAHAGSVGSTPIPAEARGQAYVQNHPIEGEWAYDAITEVWFDDLDDLRQRIEWMDQALADAPDDLFGAHHLFAVREELL